jgi:hypothetical protein
MTFSSSVASAAGDLVSSSASVPSKDTNSFGTSGTVGFFAGQACRPSARLDGTGSGCSGSNTALHFGHMIGSLLRSKNLAPQLLQRRFAPSSGFVTSNFLCGRNGRNGNYRHPGRPADFYVAAIPESRDQPSDITSCAGEQASRYLAIAAASISARARWQARRRAGLARPLAALRPRPSPRRALAVVERRAILDLLRAPRFADQGTRRGNRTECLGGSGPIPAIAALFQQPTKLVAFQSCTGDMPRSRVSKAALVPAAGIRLSAMAFDRPRAFILNGEQ